MMFSVVTTVLVSLSTLVLCEANQCLCVHERRAAYVCQDSAVGPPAAFLDQDGETNNCLLTAPNVITKQGWKAGIHVDTVWNEQRLVYIQGDDLDREVPCSLKRLSVKVNFNPTCTQLKPGTSLNPPVLPVFTTAPTTKPTPPTTTSTPSPTTTVTTSTAAPTTKPTLPIFTTAPITATTVPKATATSATKAPVFIPVPSPKPSTNCDWKKMLQLAMSKTQVTHPSSRACPSGNTANSEALLYNACNSPSVNFHALWKSDIKVIDNCHLIPKGEPIGVFVGGGFQSIGMHAAFWQCTGTSFKVMYQSCTKGYPIIEDVTVAMGIPPDMVYTIRW